MNLKSKLYLVNPKKWNKHHKIHFILNIIFGFIIAFVLHFLEITPFGNSILASEMDNMIAKEAKKAKNIDSNIIFIDIDSNTEFLWNTNFEETENYKYRLNSVITRRDSLTALLRKVASFSPEIIVVDMMFKYYSIDEKHDSSLISFIEAFKTHHTNSSLILPFPGSDVNLEEHKIYQHIINSNNIYFASVHVASEFDERKIRYIYSYNKDDKNNIYWSVPIIVYALRNKISLSDLTLEELHRRGIKLEDENPFHYEGINFLSSRIRYTLIPTIYDKSTGEPTFFGNIDGNPDIKFSGLEIISYQDGDVEPYHSDKYLEKKFNNNIVVIGNSTYEKNDIIYTPIGEIPGMYVIGNSINTILNLGLIKSPPVILFILIESVTILICAYLFLFLKDIIASIFGFIVIGIPLAYASYLIFELTGYFLTANFAVIGIGIHKIIVDIEKLVSNVKQKADEINKIEYKEIQDTKIHFNQ